MIFFVLLAIPAGIIIAELEYRFKKNIIIPVMMFFFGMVFAFLIDIITMWPK